MNRQDEPITVVVPGDLHLTEAGLDNHRTAQWMVGEVNELIRPDFVQFIGHNVQDAIDEQFRIFDDLRSQLTVPHYALVGDHEVQGDQGAARFREHVGETFGTISLRGFRFLRLDTQQAKPLGITEGQAAWFRSQVDDATAAGERVIVFQHNYLYQIWETFDGPGIDVWHEVVQTRRVSATVSGHTHYGQVANDGRNVVIAVRSIGDPEGGPPGYAIVHLDGEDFAITYRSVEDAGPVVLITHPRESLLAIGPRHVVSGPDRVRVRAWSAPRIEAVRASLDDGEWFDLSSREPDRWSGPLQGDRLSKGEHTVEVEAIDAEGRSCRRKVGFPVDPTGRYTAVPTAQPVVTSTNFC